ncbi:MAG: hypothetical protein QF486_03120 [Candidatus Woesearchaeota archaeon]|jgi:hypothetical protein|nr:hypothetical protein [Candidatus Woesearchaeota archaeon]MDP7181545.1 hypothetical protein [Candidatus Woesearchaeota archaeon]MDP7198587.1 hypothetical protein [Candidatus Woesearchaeota archaeon]MDP7466671.1 hypothetical protein [Candidatus Woesearchaeota archaeon]MDP7646927.1 hypothetical protein [Candidatus Woesearchaeota archaeon]|tara:strand:+ start:37 stop:483 length:447 start_codon:yes stop_codon:yes gene_type:complete
MALQPLQEHEKPFVAAKLAENWQERGLNFDQSWAEECLQHGHRRTIVGDEFYTYKVNKKILGMVSLVTFEGGVAEIRDSIELTDSGVVLKNLLTELIEVSKMGDVRKLYSLVLKNNTAIYTALGFKKEGELLDHFKEGEDLTIMSLLL